MRSKKLFLFDDTGHARNKPRQMSSAKKFTLITLGEELLLGLTANSHLTYIGEQLRRRGVTLHRNLTISDEDSEIRDRFLECWKDSDVVITSGGLGPTADDRTKESIAQALGEKLILDQASLEWIQKIFDDHGRKMTSNNRKQAYRPENAEAIHNDHGTAPGIWLEREGKILIMLPGPPSELQPMFESLVIPRLKSGGLLSISENFLQIRTIGIGESALEIKLQPFFKKHPDLKVAYCAHKGQVDLRISFVDALERSDELSRIANDCRKALGGNFLCMGYDDLPTVISEILKARGQSLALAESCTGGLISNTLTDIPGSSEFFVGSVVCYSVEAKLDLLNVPKDKIQQHSVVSEEVAMAMAEGAAERFQSDYVLSVTGYAGPTGGADDKPVGTVFIGLRTPRKTMSIRCFWNASRKTIKERTLIRALNLLRLELISEADERDLESKPPSNDSGKALRSTS